MPANALHGLYAITDSKLTDDSLTDDNQFVAAIEQALLGGARIIQYRDKSKSDEKRLRQCNLIRGLSDEHDTCFIVNDDVELARHCAADGVHLGRDDAGIAKARQRLGSDCIIGISCYNDLQLAVAAQTSGADYVAFGAFFASPTKPAAVVATTDLLLQAKQQLTVPVCAIGGITLENAGTLVQSGADMTAIISGLFSQGDIRTTASQLSQLFR